MAALCKAIIPNILVISNDEVSGKQIIEGIVDSSSIDMDDEFLWTIDNKYYTATVKFHIASKSSLSCLDKNILDSSEAILIYLSSLKFSSMKELDKTLSIIDYQSYEVMLLICDGYTDQNMVLNCPELSKSKVQEWCIENSWELVELNQEEESDCSEDDDFPDSFGYQRIKQALYANTWSNLSLKDEKTDKGLGQVLQAMTLNSEDSHSKLTYSQLEEELAENTEPELGDDFSYLLSSLNEMKDKASEFSSDDRKAYAEKMALAFWKSIGGNEDEIQGLDSDDSLE